MKVLQQNFNSLAENKLSNAMPKAKAQYATELQSLLTTVRQYNKTFLTGSNSCFCGNTSCKTK